MIGIKLFTYLYIFDMSLPKLTTTNIRYIISRQLKKLNITLLLQTLNYCFTSMNEKNNELDIPYLT